MADSLIITTPYDVSDHLRTPEEMIAYLDAYIEGTDGDSLLIAKVMEDIAVAQERMREAREYPDVIKPLSELRKELHQEGLL